MSLSLVWQYFAIAGVTLFCFNLVWNFFIMVPLSYLFAFLKIYKVTILFRIIGFYFRASLFALTLTSVCSFQSNKICFFVLLIISTICLINILWRVIHIWVQKCQDLLDYSFFNEIPESLIFDIYLISFSVLFFIISSFKPVIAGNIINNNILFAINFITNLFFIGVVIKIIGAIYIVFQLFNFIKKLF